MKIRNRERREFFKIKNSLKGKLFHTFELSRKIFQPDILKKNKFENEEEKFQETWKRNFDFSKKVTLTRLCFHISILGYLSKSHISGKEEKCSFMQTLKDEKIFFYIRDTPESTGLSINTF